MAATVIVPRRREDFFNPDGTFTLRALRFFESLTDVTNENTGDIDTDGLFGGLENGVNAEELAEDAQDDFNYQQEVPVWQAVSTNSNYTMVSYDFVNAKVNSSITFFKGFLLFGAV